MFKIVTVMIMLKKYKDKNICSEILSKEWMSLEGTRKMSDQDSVDVLWLHLDTVKKMMYLS